MSGQPPPPSRTASVGPSNAGGMNAPAASTPGGQGPGNPQNLNQIVSANDPRDDGNSDFVRLELSVLLFPDLNRIRESQSSDKVNIPGSFDKMTCTQTRAPLHVEHAIKHRYRRTLCFGGFRRVLGRICFQ
nr:hypothetical protein CFP56_69651 [Quercus suber]